MSPPWAPPGAAFDRQVEVLSIITIQIGAKAAPIVLSAEGETVFRLETVFRHPMHIPIFSDLSEEHKRFIRPPGLCTQRRSPAYGLLEATFTLKTDLYRNRRLLFRQRMLRADQACWRMAPSPISLREKRRSATEGNSSELTSHDVWKCRSAQTHRAAMPTYLSTGCLTSCSLPGIFRRSLSVCFPLLSGWSVGL